MLLLLVVEVGLSELFRKLSEVVLRMVKLSFLTRAVDNIDKTNRNTSGLNSMRFFPEGFLEVVGILRALYVLEGFSFRTLKYF